MVNATIQKSRANYYYEKKQKEKKNFIQKKINKYFDNMKETDITQLIRDKK